MNLQRFLSAAALVALCIPSTSLAATYIGEEMISVQNPIGEDTYAAGGKVVFEDTVNGDLIVGGGEVTISGRVAQDVFLGGGKLRVRGNVGDDLRAVGGEVIISGNVQGDLIVFGGTVEILDGVTINGDLVVNGGQVTMNGTVRGDSIINAGVLFFGGTTVGDVTFKGDKLYANGTFDGNLQSVSKKLILGDNALFRGEVEYWTMKGEVDFGNTLLGTATFNDELKPYSDRHVRGAKAGAAAALGALFAGAMLFKLLSALLVITIAVFGTRKYFNDGVKVLKKEPWKNALYGVLYFIATPIIAAVFLVSLIGIPVGAAIIALYAITIVFAKPLTAILLTKYWESRRPKKAKPLTNWQLIFFSLGAYVLLKIIAFIPVVGWLVAAFAICAAYGALMRIEYAKYLKVR